MKRAIWYPFTKTLAIYAGGVIRSCFYGKIAEEKLHGMRDTEIIISIDYEVTVVA